MIYRLTYCNKDGVEARVDIQKGSSTPIIEVEGTGRPFILSYNNDKGDKSGMFLSSSADIEIYETTDFNIDNLKTSNETELSVTHYINNIVSWQGFIIPDFFSIEVRSNPVITMTASDRLGTLKNATLSDLPTMVNIRELTLTCLSKTGLSLPLKTIADFSNDGTVNAFFSYHIDSQRIKDIKGRSISCYDILSSILIASHSKLVQRAGEWVIINKLQHEIGSGKIYSSLSSFTNYLENIYNFDEVSIGARRTIMPVAGSVGIYHEHGGRKSHPENYDFSLNLSGWNSVNGFVATIEDRHIIGFLGGTPLFDPDRTIKQYLLNYNNWIDDTNNLNTAPYITTDAIQINSPRADRVEVTVDISSIMAEKLSSNTAISFLRYAVILTNGIKTYTLTKAGIFEELDPENISGHSLLLRGGQQPPLLLASPAFSNSDSFKGLFEVGEEDDVNNYSASIRVYGSGNQYVTVNYALIKFSDVSELPKGTMYKTEQGEVFTKAYDIETSIFGDYLLSGLDGYFYRYPNDDTSSIYKDVNTLSTPVWTTPSIPNETSELPLLHHSMRQMRRMFSVAHDLLSAEIEASNFDPLAIFVACGIRHTVVSAQFDFFKSNLSVELEEVAFQNATVRDFIYSYFGDGESGIKSVGGISGGSGGGSTGGGLTPEQLEILSWWKKDPDNPDTIFTEMNAYSTKELSAYGAGDGGGGGGSDYERLDTWASYDSSRAGWVLSAFLGNDLNMRVTAIDGRVTDLENSAGSGSVTSVGISVPTGLSVSNSPITSSGVIAIGLQAGYSIPTTEKQGQWDGVVTDFNNLEIGGRNYLRNSSTTKHVEAGEATAHFNVFNVNDLKGNSISFSMEVFNVVGFTRMHIGIYNLTELYLSTEVIACDIVNGKVKREGMPIPNTTDSFAVIVYAGVHGQTSGNSYDFKHEKAEKGNKATDWSPAPEDQVSDWNTTDVNSLSFIKNKPTTLAGYGITDAYTKTEVNSALISKLDKSVFDDLFEKVEVSTGVFAIKAKYNFYGVGEVSAYGIGSGGGSGGGIIETVYAYGNLGQTFNNNILTDTFNAYTINQINTRLVSVESGSATTVNTTGTGNAITSISKAGSVITANKDLTFSLSNHLHTGVYEPVFTKNTAFNKNFGTASGTVAEGNHTHNYLPLSGGTMSGDWAITATEGVNAGVRTYKLGGDGILWAYRPTTLEAIRHGIGFGWYDTEWVIGNIRGGGGDSYGFGIGYRSDRTNAITGAFRIATNGTAYLNNVAIATVNSNVASATKLQTARTIWGQSFDGTGNVTGALTGVGSITGSASTLGIMAINQVGGIVMDGGVNAVRPYSSQAGTENLGTSNVRWNTLYAVNGDFSGSVTIRSAAGNSPLKVRGIDGYRDSTGLLDNLYLNYVSTKDILMVNGGGNVGIGTVSPSEKLHVVGNIFATGEITAVNGDFLSNVTIKGATSNSPLKVRGIDGYLPSTGLLDNLYLNFVSTKDILMVNGGGNVGIGTVSPSEKLHVIGNILATGTTTTTKVIFNSAGWSMEQTGTELLLKYNDLIAARFLSDGSIVGLGEITAYGATTGGEGVSLLRTGGTMTGNLTMSADIIMNSGRAIGVSNLPLKLLGNALTYNASNVLTEANTATQIKMGNGWTIEQTVASLTIRKDGVIKGTFNA